MKKILFISTPFFAEQVQSLLAKSNAQIDYIDKDKKWANLSLLQKYKLLRNYNLVHFFWAEIKLKNILITRLAGLHIINHFIGTDLSYFISLKLSKRIKGRLALFFSNHVYVVSESLKLELGSFAIKSKLWQVNLSNILPDRDIPKFNPRGTILSYVPTQRKSFYGSELIHKLAEDFPNEEFTILTMEEKAKQKGNIHYLPKISQANVLEHLYKTKLFLRLTEHDGFPNSIVEALALGKYVITTQKIEACITISSYMELRNEFEKLLKMDKKNDAGIRYINKYFTIDKMRNSFSKHYQL